MALPLDPLDTTLTDPTAAPSASDDEATFDLKAFARVDWQDLNVDEMQALITELVTFITQYNANLDDINLNVQLAAATAEGIGVTPVTSASANYDGGLNKFTFEIPQGVPGADGNNGTAGADGATGNGVQSNIRISGDGSAGSLDTYRMTFTNATFIDYTVQNGTNGLSGAGTGDLVALANLSDVANRNTSLTNLLPSQAGTEGYTLQSISGVATWVLVSTVPTTPTPTLSGDTSANENTDTVVTVTNFDNTATYNPSVNFGSVVDNLDGTFTISVPDFDVTNSLTFTVTANRVGENTSDAANFGITVVEVLIPVLDTPIISGAITGVENSLLVLTVTNFDVLNTYVPTVNFGSVINNNDGTFSLTLPDFAASTSVMFTVKSTRVGFQESAVAVQNISVTNTILATPIITGGSSGLESTIVVLTVTNFDGTQTYFPSVDFGSVLNNGDGTFDVTLPTFVTSALIDFEVFTTRASDIDSAIAHHAITVTEATDIPDPQAVINNDYNGNAQASANITFDTGLMKSNADAASYTEVTTDQSFLTVEGTTTSTQLDTTEEITTGQSVWIRNSENLSAALKITLGTVTGTTPYSADITASSLSSAPTYASEEGAWTEQTSTTVDFKPKVIVIDATTDSTDLKTPSLIITGEDVKFISASNPNGVPITLGTVTTESGIVSSTDPLGGGELISKYELDGDSLDTVGSFNGTASNVTFTTGTLAQAGDFSNPAAQIDSAATSVKSVSMFINKSVVPSGNSDGVIDARITSGTGFVFIDTSGNLSISGLDDIQLNGVSKINGDPFIFDDWVHAYIEFTTAESDIRIGQGSGGSTFSLDGLIDQVEFYNRALTTGEIATLSAQVILQSAAHTLGEIPTFAFFDDEITVSQSVGQLIGDVDLDTPAKTDILTLLTETWDGAKFVRTYNEETTIGRIIQRRIQIAKSGTSVFEPLTTNLTKEA